MAEKISNLLKIGKIKDESGVPIKTIRYYEEIGLIKATRRTEGGFRLFSRDAIHRLRFIKRSQLLGFSLEEINSILEIHDRGEAPCQEVRHSIEEKILEIERRIEKMEELREYLLLLLSDKRSLGKNKEDIICPIIQNDP